MKLIDCHTHSSNSFDADSTAEEMVQTALKQKLAAYAITDHCEINRWFSIGHYGVEPNDYDTFDFSLDFEKSVAESTLLKEKYADRLNLICGVELGQAPFDFGLADAVVKDKRLDFIIGSIHQIEGYDDFAFIDYNRNNPEKLLQSYFEKIYKLCEWNKFDILGHLTYPLRYITGEYGIKINLKPFEEIIRLCFKSLIKNGKGIEINTSGFREKYGVPMPELEYVRLFRDLGGEIISIGSDAHCTDDLGKNIIEGAEMAKAAGFNYLCYFKERKPNFISIK